MNKFNNDMDIQNIYTSIEKPKMVSKRYGRSTMYYVPYDIFENNGTYSYKYVPVIPDDYNYGGLVDAIIGVKYPLKECLAVINNYLFDPENEEYKMEFSEMQEWRKFAKLESRKHFNMEL